MRKLHCPRLAVCSSDHYAVDFPCAGTFTRSHQKYLRKEVEFAHASQEGVVRKIGVNWPEEYNSMFPSSLTDVQHARKIPLNLTLVNGGDRLRVD